MKKCVNCGHGHEGQKCPLVKAFEYYPDGELKRIEFVTIADMGGGFELVNLEELPPGTTLN